MLQQPVAYARGSVVVSLVVGQDVILRAGCLPAPLRRLAIGAQVINLPHTLKLTHYRLGSLR